MKSRRRLTFVRRACKLVEGRRWRGRGRGVQIADGRRWIAAVLMNWSAVWRKFTTHQKFSTSSLSVIKHHKPGMRAIATDGVKWRHSNLWSRYDLHVVWKKPPRSIQAFSYNPPTSRHTTRRMSNIHTSLHTYIHANLYSAKIVETNQKRWRRVTMNIKSRLEEVWL